MLARKSRLTNDYEHPYLSVFIAEVVLRCDQCGAEIPIGSLFTYAADRYGKTIGIRYRHCGTCIPVNLCTPAVPIADQTPLS